MKTLLLIAVALLVASAAKAKDCIKVDDDHSPVAVLSGQVTKHHKGGGPRTASGGRSVLEA